MKTSQIQLKEKSGYIQTDNRWTTRVTKWQPRDGRRQGGQRTRWADEIGSFLEMA